MGSDLTGADTKEDVFYGESMIQNFSQSRPEHTNLSLTAQIAISLLAGIVCGIVLILIKKPEWTQYIKVLGTIFLNLVKFTIVPVVFFSLVPGILEMNDIKKLGNIGLKTVLFFTVTTIFALIIGLEVADGMKSFFPPLQMQNAVAAQRAMGGHEFNFIPFIINMIPSNPIEPILQANMLQIIIIAFLVGGAIIITGEKAAPLVSFFNSGNAVSMTLMNIILKLAPIGVFGLVTPVVVENGPMVLSSLAMVIVTVYIAYILQTFIVYPLFLKIFTKYSPLSFFRKLWPAIMFAFASSSSLGTLPINLKCTEKMGCNPQITRFVLPLGATVHMDGTAIYQGVCAIFIATCYGIDLTLGEKMQIVLLSVTASIGTAGVPGSGAIMLAMVLKSVNLPLEGIALLFGIDRILDMGRTIVNIAGDSCVALVVDKDM